jgi:hypothetical protein
MAKEKPRDLAPRRLSASTWRRCLRGVGEFVFVDEAPDCCDALPGSVAVLHRLFPLVVVLLIGIVLYIPSAIAFDAVRKAMWKHKHRAALSDWRYHSGRHHYDEQTQGAVVLMDCTGQETLRDSDGQRDSGCRNSEGFVVLWSRG